MSQVKVWHARLRETTSIGTSNAYIYSALGIPGLASRGSCPSGEAQKDERVDFQSEGLTSSHAAHTVNTGPTNVGIPPAPPSTKAEGFEVIAEVSPDHLRTPLKLVPHREDDSGLAVGPKPLSQTPIEMVRRFNTVL